MSKLNELGTLEDKIESGALEDKITSYVETRVLDLYLIHDVMFGL